MLLLQLSGPPFLTAFSKSLHWLKIQEHIEIIEYNYTKSFPPRISSSSLHLSVICEISSQSSLLDPLDHPHSSLFSNHQLTPVSRSRTAPSGMPHLICGTSFLLLFMFLMNSILHHHPALLRRHALITDHVLTFLVVFSTLALKLFFLKVFPFIAVYLFFTLISWNYDHSFFCSYWWW